MVSDWAAAARLVRRTGFGATGTDVDAAVTEGAQKYVARILAADPAADPGARRTPPPTFGAVPTVGKDSTKAEKSQRDAVLNAQDRTLTAWWLQRMLLVQEPFTEKVTFAWHSHFATSLKKVNVAGWMLQQNERLRSLGTGDFGTLASTMLTDAATLKWLDGEKNTVMGPNENLSREFMEIYTLGHSDGYTEGDVRAGARALTGLVIDQQSGATSVLPRLHDSGTKTLFGRTGDLGAQDFCDGVLGRAGCPDYIVTRMYNRFVSDDPPSKETLERLVGDYGETRDLRAMFTTMFTDPSFAAAEASFIVGPVEWLIGAMRALRVDAVDSRQLRQVRGGLDSLGQLPFYPPSVGGWPSGQVWMSTAAADLRFGIAMVLGQRADLSTITGSTSAKLDALAHLLGVESWSSQSLAVLKGSATDPVQLAAVALNTPEYLVH